VYAVWPVKKIISLLGASFLQEFHKKRAERNIMLKVIWPSDESAALKQYSFLRIGQEQKREARLAPEAVNFSLGYAIYGNTVRFISSSRENFGFLVESSELAEMMRSQFDLIWEASRQLR
jgi:hypothetical protein